MSDGANSIKVQVMVSMDHPKEKSKHACKLTLEDRVQELLECIESGYDSETEWLLLNKLYNNLQRRKLTDRIRNLKKMIEPMLAKYGYHKTTSKGKN